MALRGRRLAYLDSHFPWQGSGFRYADGLALLSARPDTVFFSMYALRDPFPVPVYPLASFPRLAPSLGITDVYGVFLDFMSGVLGLGPSRRVPPGPMLGLDLSAVLRRLRIRAHVGLYPGGGFLPSDAGFSDVAAIVQAADSVFSWMPEVVDRFPEITLVRPAIVNTSYYSFVRRDFGSLPLQLLFVADARPRKGLDIALAAMTLLERERVHLHVVGPHDSERWKGDPGRVTFHGWLAPEAIRRLHRTCHVFVSPVRAEEVGGDGDGGVTDGFPTTAAGEALSSGCLLISGNPNGDYRALRPNLDYLEVAPDPSQLADRVREVMKSPGSAASVAFAGAHRVRQRLDVRVGCEDRLRSMRLDDPMPGTFFSRSIPSLSRVFEGTSRWRRRRPMAVLHNQLAAMRDELAALKREVADVRPDSIVQPTAVDDASSLNDQVTKMSRQLPEIGRAAIENLTGVRRALNELRQEPTYRNPYDEPTPLVTVCIPTYTNVTGLIERSLPSVLSQSYERLEVIVVGDAAPPEAEQAVARLGDPRVRFENLTVRGPYPTDPHERWLVAGTGPLNASIERASGSWLVIHNDDDVLRPSHVESLLDHARTQRVEVAYGRFEFHTPGGIVRQLGKFPPQLGEFGWQAAITHGGVAKLFLYELYAFVFDEPGDWNRARRMLHAGVSFSMLDAFVFDYYPSAEWQTP